MIDINSLTKSFGTGSNKLEVLKGIDMSLKRGELVALMGPSGCGKSTLLNIIGGLLPADSGEINLDSRKYGLKNPSAVVDVRRTMVGWIFQDFHLLDHLTALDNVAMALEISGVPSKEAEKRALAALQRVNLGDRVDHIPDQLSGGQQQRVAIARAIAGERPLLLADEPTGNLDSKTGKEVMTLFKELNDTGQTIILITHEESVAKQSNRIITIKDGLIKSDNRETYE